MSYIINKNDYHLLILLKLIVIYLGYLLNNLFGLLIILVNISGIIIIFGYIYIIYNIPSKKVSWRNIISIYIILIIIKENINIEDIFNIEIYYPLLIDLSIYILIILYGTYRIVIT